MLYYKNYDNDNELNIEIYNDLDIAGIITNNKKTIEVFDIYENSFSKIISIFKKK